jgi:sphingomyelin phosphodiesterase acid-like 3
MQPYIKAPVFLSLCLIAWLAATPATASPTPPHMAAHNFLIASDLHFNPMADATLVDALNQATPTQWESILNRSQNTAFSDYGEDTNWWLLRSALDAMHTTLPHPALILLTGDFLAHDFPAKYRDAAKNHDPESYRKFVLNTMQFVALQLQKRFPRTPILMTPGNNDDDCQDYSIEAGGAFLQDTAELVRKLARANGELTSSWGSLGSYDVANPAVPHARILAINTVFFSAKYQSQTFSKSCAAASSTAPQDLFAWLEQRLSRAQEAHEKVWLMFHIPPGMDGFATLRQYVIQLLNGKPPGQICRSALTPMWAPQWTAQFDALLEKYHDTVTVAFAGHTHTDDFRVINASSSSPSFVIIDPPISPIYHQNPSFRVVSFGAKAAISDQSVYYLANLDRATRTIPGEWKREYTFSQEWKMQGVNAKNLSAIYSEVASDESERAQWLKLYNVSSSAARLPAEMAPALYCVIEGLDAASYGDCFCSAVTRPQQ